MPAMLLLLILPLVVQNSTAERAHSAQRRALLDIDEHLGEVHRLIDAAEQVADPDARIQFQYDWLRGDIAIIRAGIRAQLDASVAEPATADALFGDYRR